jgi:hypothetical protein
MRNALPSLALLILAGCATSTAGSTAIAPGPPPRVNEVGAGYDVRIDQGGVAAAFNLPASREAAWPSLLSAYQKMGLPLTSSDATQGTATARDVEVRRKLAGEPLSEYLDCGSNMTGLIANSYTVHLTVESTLKPAPQGGSTLAVGVSGSARNPQGASSSPVNCASTGRLESAIARLAGAAGGQ